MTETRWFVRTAAVLVGLANLAVLAHFFGGSPALPTGVVWEDVSLRDATPYVLCAVVASLVVSEVAIRWFDRLAVFGRFVFFEKLSRPRAGIVGAVCLGGTLMGVLLSATLLLRVSPESVWMLPLTGSYGAVFGAVLGTIEGLLLAPPLAAVLRRFDEDRSSPRTAA